MGKRSHWWGHARNIAIAYGLSWLWVTIFVHFLQAIGLAKGGQIDLMPITSHWLSKFGGIDASANANPWLTLFMLLAFAPFIEEVLFRMFPLSLVQGQSAPKVRAVVLAVCGIIFGYLHGSPINVFIQGAFGVALGWLYLKNSTSQWASYISCVIAHFLYNLTVLIATLLS